MNEFDELGRVAWDAYARAVGGKTFDEKPLPTWEELGERQKEGWASAAQAIAEELPNE